MTFTTITSATQHQMSSRISLFCSSRFPLYGGSKCAIHKRSWCLGFFCWVFCASPQPRIVLTTNRQLSVCAISIVRLHYITFLKNSIDITWTISSVYVWSTLEPCISIICACLPALQPVIQSAMKLEYIIHIRTSLLPSKRARRVLRLRKHFSNSSNSSTLGLRPMTSSMYRPRSVEPGAEIETHCAPVKTASPNYCPKVKRNLQEYLGPMYIMVQHDVEWSETHVHAME